MDIILYLLKTIQQLNQTIGWLLNFICRYIPLRQWEFEDSHSPKYQKLKIDRLPVIKPFIKQDWQFLLRYYEWKYHKVVRPVQRRNGRYVPETVICPVCGAPHQYIYDNNGGKGEYLCKVCGQTFMSGSHASKPMSLLCPHCGRSLVPVKDRKHFVVHKCISPKCPYYLNNLKKVDKADLDDEYGKSKYKLHYIYREFAVDFFEMDLSSLPKNASSLKFRRHDAHVMSLCLTLHVNLQLSLRKTSQALLDLYNISISHQQISNYCKTAAICIKPFVDNYDYNTGTEFVADETYIRWRKVKGYVWLIMDAAKRSIIGYQVSDNRGVGPCIMAMRMAFRHLKKIPDDFRFIADGYSAYPLAAQQFFRRFGEKFRFDITRVIGLSNDDAVSTQFRSYKQLIERLNRTYKESYRPTNGFGSIDGANYDLALWVAYYNFLRPHRYFGNRILNRVPELENAENMPGKWQLLILLGQQTILNLHQQNCS